MRKIPDTNNLSTKRRMSSSPQLSSFDPAIHLHSNHDIPSEFCSDLEAAREQQEELHAWNQQHGIVIQHRSWNPSDVAWSEPDRSGGSPSRFGNTTFAHLNASSLPSSPPVANMPFISSPVAYPPTSSPTGDTPKKRKRPEGSRDPLKDVAPNGVSRTIAGFLAEDESDDEAGFFSTKVADLKKRRFSISAKEPVAPVNVPARAEKSLDDPTFQSALEPPSLAPNSIDEAQPDDIIPTSTPNSSGKPRTLLSIVSSSGKKTYLTQRTATTTTSYERLIASRSTVAAPGQAQRSYYGLDIHQLLKEAEASNSKPSAIPPQPIAQVPVLPSTEGPDGKRAKRPKKTLLWTEKYRARKFTDLLGDERTHRQVLRWLKSWDPIVFPGVQRSTLHKKSKFAAAQQKQKDDEGEQAHRKILLLTGPPGLGKTTLAHVCARQAGYEVHEINASDERSRDVVKGRIKDMVGTENVRGVTSVAADGKSSIRKAGRPVCVVVDEVDGVVAGSSGGGGGGEGGFIKALLDLIALDAKNANRVGPSSAGGPGKKQKGEKFRLLRPIVLICNDVYAPALRPLRQSALAEIVHMRKPTINAAIARMQSVFEREGIKAESDGVRRLCEATWGVGRRGDRARDGQGEGDIRSLLVVGEWVAGRLKAAATDTEARLTRRWVETNVLADLSHGGGGARNMGRGGAKDVVERVFLEGAGFPNTIGNEQIQAKATSGSGTVGVAEAIKRRAMERLREMVDASGEHDRIATDCFATYPSIPYQDTTLLTKPTQAYDWLHFHDTISSAVHSSQEWELFPYLSQSTLAFHHLFATSAAQTAHYGGARFADDDNDANKPELSQFLGPNASWHASETLKANTALVHELQSNLNIPLARMYKAPSALSTELLPYLLRILSPDVKPVVINTSTGGTDSMRSKNNISTASVRKASEKEMVMRSVNAMLATGVTFERAKVEIGEDVESRASGGWVYRMAPSLDGLGVFETLRSSEGKAVGNRYGVRSVIASEYVKEKKKVEEDLRRKRMAGMVDLDGEVGVGVTKESEAVNDDGEKKKAVKKDFFGRVLKEVASVDGEMSRKVTPETLGPAVWVTFHEGYSNAVRKPITIAELMRGL